MNIRTQNEFYSRLLDKHEIDKIDNMCFYIIGIVSTIIFLVSCIISIEYGNITYIISIHSVCGIILCLLFLYSTTLSLREGIMFFTFGFVGLLMMTCMFLYIYVLD